MSWGWRLPFLASFLLIVVGIFVRMRITETPVYTQAVVARGKVERNPAMEALRQHPRNFFVVLGARMAENGLGYFFPVFGLSYVITTLGVPKAEALAAYGRDFATFRAFMKDTAPGVTILGPGTIGTGADAKALFAVSAAGIDAISYHHYGALSARCSGDRTARHALSDQWLARTGKTLAFYQALRDRLAPGRPVWLTETAETACGGNRWAATFADTFRYLDQLGRLAKAGVQVVMHNTLAASDYGLLDEQTHLPRPNYWAALLWRRLMGTTVLDAGVDEPSGLHVYAHCARDVPDGIALLVINNDRRMRRKLTLPAASQRYTLASERLVDGNVGLNGSTLALGPSDEMPALNGEPAPAGALVFAPATITFLTVANAGNTNCR
ncbi:hypothetical protein ACVIGA_006749 [Bradyrhizobium sp. USDA 3240]